MDVAELFYDHLNGAEFDEVEYKTVDEIIGLPEARQWNYLMA